MANSFGVPEKIEKEIRLRDKRCVYCRGEMKAYKGIRGTPADKATIEHFNFAGPFYWKDGLKAEDLAICCQSCNSSRGTKTHMDWFQSFYCVQKGITPETVADPVKDYLRRKRLIRR